MINSSIFKNWLFIIVFALIKSSKDSKFVWSRVWAWVIFSCFFFAKIILFELSDKIVWSLPFKIITIASGLFQLNLIVFILCSFIARGCRFYLIAFLLYIFGETIKKFIDRYFNILTILFFILLVSGVLLLGYLWFLKIGIFYY